MVCAHHSVSCRDEKFFEVAFLVDASSTPVIIKDIVVQICNESDDHDESFQSRLKVKGNGRCI